MDLSELLGARGWVYVRWYKLAIVSGGSLQLLRISGDPPKY